MYLKKIITVGFKSFANEINIDLSIGTTGIVGPNGSGKSNVVDAVRWVLGEQSVKSLRGDSSVDIIFSGSDEKKPANYASVTLIFDNADKFLPIEYSEVSIKRILYRNLENEYFINNNKCRLKDISDLLIDSGINKESFNIISQGEVSDIISSRASDRRIIFDSASGVLKYRKRKEEAIKKLEKTHDNLERVNDIISELELQVEPLRKSKENALKYLDVKESLKNIDIALIASDIRDINFILKKDKTRIKEIDIDILNIETNNNVDDSSLLELKNKLSSIDEEIFNNNKLLNEISGKVEKLNGEKNLLLEKKKSQIEDKGKFEKVNKLKESILNINNEIEKINNIININNKDLDNISLEQDNNNKNINKLKSETNMIERDITLKNKQIIEIKNNIEIIESNIEGNINISARSIINNKRLSGIHNTVGSLIDVEEKYLMAINTSLATSVDFIVCDNKKSAEQAIEYLKSNNLGRATFFPIDTISKREVDNSIINKLHNVDGFIDMAIDLVKYKNIYYDIISNLLGNVIVADTVENANKISALLNKRYKIVTLTGEVVHVGGSITGGNIKSRSSILTEKQKLFETKNKLEILISSVEELNKKDNLLNSEINKKENNNYEILKNKVELEEINNSKNLIRNQLIKEKENLDIELNSLDDITDESYLEEYYKAIAEKENLILLLDNLNKTKKELFNSIEEKEIIGKKNQGLYNNLNRELNNIKISINKNEILLDNLLNTLNEEYSLTYERAINEYILEMEVDIARARVVEYKNIIKSLGMVNIDSIEEFEKVNSRYEFLISQKDDLYEAESNLISIITEFDTIMKEKFSTNFEMIKKEFENVFKELFGGGHARLELTEPSNLLDTGIEIIASPPGKTLTSISLLSGGEKTLTAISLLFSIIKTKQIPFCLLDEVEAALDEINVDKFGEYLNKLKNKTQFIVITHKKKTMEYVDYLYGITMDKSGISKLVSVKLDDIKL